MGFGGLMEKFICRVYVLFMITSLKLGKQNCYSNENHAKAN